jgi:hypothetical protein
VRVHACSPKLQLTSQHASLTNSCLSHPSAAAPASMVHHARSSSSSSNTSGHAVAAAMVAQDTSTLFLCTVCLYVFAER